MSMITPNKLESKVVNLLLPRLQDEYDAFYHYRAISNWCKGEGFEKAAKYFEAESSDELIHAKKLELYLVDWNVIPSLPSIEPAKLIYKSLIECIEASYKIEYDLYEAYEITANDMLKVDLCTFSLMQEMLEIQLKSVAEYSDKLNTLKGVSGTKFELLLLEEQLF